ncbi:hypothetical protein [Massilia sp. Leaf139]|uniref:hypothetical protein n=1 Tax=Massilia sp. Leaf139 TaxID=1736272 RepID=UPI000700552A|nr:hypothetical protein [Massilia sp. Leaf139]KQQ93640.1 hypothetical protein ASF77_22410 [Massilia sp. Leaf139]
MSLTATLGIFTAPTLRRVRREEVAKPAFNKPDPYALLMACWVDHMRTNDRDLSAGGMKLATDAGQEIDVHAAQRAADLKTGEAVGVMIDGLSQLHRWAICKSQGISRGWRFPNADYATALQEARAELEEKLRKHIATRLYFL